MVAAWGRKPGDRPRSIPKPTASSSFFSRPRSECIWSSRLQGAGLQLQPSDRISTGYYPQRPKEKKKHAWVKNIWSGPTAHRCPEHISGGSGGSGSCGGGGGGDALKSQVTLPFSAPRRLEPQERARCLSTDSQQVDAQFDKHRLVPQADGSVPSVPSAGHLFSGSHSSDSSSCAPQFHECV